MKINHCISIKCVSLFASAEIKKTVAYTKAQYMCKYPVSLAGDCCAPDAIWLI